jgi:hypothetical protein
MAVRMVGNWIASLGLCKNILLAVQGRRGASAEQSALQFQKLILFLSWLLLQLTSLRNVAHTYHFCELQNTVTMGHTV